MPVANVILQWLVLGMSPLTLEQLAIVVTFDPLSGDFDSSLGLAHPDDVIQLCSSLVIRAADDTVQLAHASVKEYFLQKPRATTLWDIESGHAAIAHCCLEYLLHVGWQKHVKYTKFPLFKYSAKFWLDHYKHSNKSSNLQEIVTVFFQAKGSALKTWIKEYYGVLNNYYGNVPLNHAAMLGLEEIIKRLMVTSEWLGTHGTSIEAAAKGGHISTVRVLLDGGANVNAKGGEYCNALYATSYIGYTEIARLLLVKGADVNAQGGKYGNASQAAISEGLLRSPSVALVLH